MEAITQNDSYIYVNGEKKTFVDKIINVLAFVLIVYEGWYIEKFGAIPYLLQILAALLIGFTLLKEIPSFTGKIRLITPATGWFFFGLVSFFVAVTKSYATIALQSLFTYFSFWSVCLCIGMACRQDSALIRKALVTVILLSIVSAFFDGYNYKNGMYYGITLGPNNNPNTLGSTMTIGVYYLLNPQKKTTWFNWGLRILVTVMCLIIVIRTGSRSGLLCFLIAVTLTLFFQFLAYDDKTNSRIIRRFFIASIIVIAGLSFWDYLKNLENGSSGIHRLLNEFSIDAFYGRTNLYVEAWEVFKQHPVFGIGYKCFEYLSNSELYTHSTYMELLSCSGIVGFVLFLYPFVRASIVAWKHRKTDMGRTLIFLLICLVRGLFGIVYYNLVVMVTLYYEIMRARKLETGENDGKAMCA